LVPARSLALRALRLACLLQQSAYDCMYVAWAEAAGRALKLAAEGSSSRLTAIDVAQFAA
jgi:hypothetical protein